MTELPEDFKPVPCRLEGENGNAFAIMGRVKKALKKAGWESLIPQYTKEAMSGDYDNLLEVTLRYVDDSEEE